jgi:hypothetical protein
MSPHAKIACHQSRRSEDMKESLLRAFVRTQKLLFEESFGWFFLVILAVLLLRNGIWVIPNIWASLKFSQNLAVNPLPGHPLQYLLSNFLSPLAAFLLHLNGNLISYTIMHLVFLILGLWAVLWLINRKFGGIASRASAIFFLSLPISSVVTTWLGYDVFTFILGSFLVLVRHPVSGLCVGFLLGLNHFEQGLFIILGLAWVVSFSEEENSKFRFLPALIGLVAAKAALIGYFELMNFNISAGRYSVTRSIGLKRLAELHLRGCMPILYSTFGVGWLLVLKMYNDLHAASRKMIDHSIAACLALFAVMLIGVDETRVFTLMTWPILLFIILKWTGKDALTGDVSSISGFINPAMKSSNLFAGIRTMKGWLILQLGLVCLVPPIIVWTGKVQSTTLFYTLEMISDLLFGTHLIKTDSKTWLTVPFNI